MSAGNPLYDPLLHEAEINPELQQALNKPPQDPAGFSGTDEIFLQEIVDKVQMGRINLYVASSLYNQDIVDKLDPEAKARVEIQAQSLLASIRELVGLWEYDHSPTYQIKNLLEKLRLTKERFELKEGDVFII